MKNLILTQSITHILLKCECNPSLLGFDYLREVISKCCQRRNYYQSFMSEIYKEVAQETNSSIEKIDKRIRVLLKGAKARKGFFAMNEYFDEIVYNGSKNLRAQESISLLIEMSNIEFTKRISHYTGSEQIDRNAC